jgi:hypothetical protein
MKSTTKSSGRGNCDYFPARLSVVLPVSASIIKAPVTDTASKVTVILTISGSRASQRRHGAEQWRLRLLLLLSPLAIGMRIGLDFRKFFSKRFSELWQQFFL